jgi:hypothetical protein
MVTPDGAYYKGTLARPFRWLLVDSVFRSKWRRTFGSDSCLSEAFRFQGLRESQRDGWPLLELSVGRKGVIGLQITSVPTAATAETTTKGIMMPIGERAADQYDAGPP